MSPGPEEARTTGVKMASGFSVDSRRASAARGHDGAPRVLGRGQLFRCRSTVRTSTASSAARITLAVQYATRHATRLPKLTSTMQTTGAACDANRAAEDRYRGSVAPVETMGLELAETGIDLSEVSANFVGCRDSAVPAVAEQLNASDAVISRRSRLIATGRSTVESGDATPQLRRGKYRPDAGEGLGRIGSWRPRPAGRAAFHSL